MFKMMNFNFLFPESKDIIIFKPIASTYDEQLPTIPKLNAI